MESQLIQDQNEITNKISYYQPGKIIINNQTFTESIIISETTPIKKWDISNIADISKKDIIFLKQQGCILIIGTGAAHIHLDLAILAKSGITAEIMSTKAACQTYTILAQEQRSVIAALII
jgi:uncharacterized protein